MSAGQFSPAVDSVDDSVDASVNRLGAGDEFRELPSVVSRLSDSLFRLLPRLDWARGGTVVASSTFVAEISRLTSASGSA